MDLPFEKKRTEKRLKLHLPLEVNLETAFGQVALGRGLEDISKSGCRLKRCPLATGVKLAEGTEYDAIMRLRQECRRIRVRLVWLSPTHCGLRLMETVPFWPIKN